MKKGLLALLIVVLMIGLLGCSSGETLVEETGEETPAESTSEWGTITAGTNASFPPFEFVEVVDGEQAIVGFDIDLINAIGDEIGADIVIEDMDFNGLIGAIQSERIDLAIAGMGITDERKESVNFSDPYFVAAQTIIVKEDAGDFENMDQLKGKEVAAQLGSTSYEEISKFEDINVKQLDEVPEAVLEVKNGMVDALIVEDTIAQVFIDDNPDLKIVVPEGLNEEEDSFAIAVGKENQELLDAINEGLQSVRDSGKYDELVSKWFE